MENEIKVGDIVAFEGSGMKYQIWGRGRLLVSPQVHRGRPQSGDTFGNCHAQEGICRKVAQGGQQLNKEVKMESKFKVGDIVSEEGSDLKYIVKSDVGSRYCLECLDTDPPIGRPGTF